MSATGPLTHEPAFRALLGAAPLDLLLLDADLRCVEASTTFSAAIGHDVGESLGPEGRALALRALGGGRSVSGSLPEGGNLTIVPVVETGQLWCVVGDGVHRQAAEVAGALVRSGTRLADAIRPDAVVAALTEAAVPDLADWCAIHVMWPGETTVTVTAAHRDPEAQAVTEAFYARYPPVRDRGAGAAIATGKPTVHREVDEVVLLDHARDDEHLEAMRALGVRSAAVLPLLARGRVLGSLTLAFTDSGRRYEEPLVATATALATQAALVLDNARLYAEQEEVAQTLQRSLLPARLPEIEGLDLAVRYRPAGRANEVGGDFYDVVATRSGAWRVVVGDIAGKGAEAAALTSLVRHTLAAAALHDPSIDEDLVLANDCLRMRAPATTFCTAAYAEVRRDGDGADVRVLTAGHPPALVLRACGTVEALPSSGPVLGVVEHVRFIPATTRLGPGDALLLYTDGAIELRGMPSQEGERRLREIVGGAAGCTAARLLERVERHTLVAGGGAPRDDLALLAVRVPSEA